MVLRAARAAAPRAADEGLAVVPATPRGVRRVPRPLPRSPGQEPVQKGAGGAGRGGAAGRLHAAASGRRPGAQHGDGAVRVPDRASGFRAAGSVATGYFAGLLLGAVALPRFIPLVIGTSRPVSAFCASMKLAYFPDAISSAVVFIASAIFFI